MAQPPYHHLPRLAATTLLILLAGGFAACAGKPGEKAAELRSRYTVELKMTQVKEPASQPTGNPLDPAKAAAAAASANAARTDVLSAAADSGDTVAAAESGDAAAVIPEAPAGPRRVEIALGFLLTRQGSEGLPGLTFDITQADPFQRIKKTYRHYLELPPMYGGKAEQLGFSLTADDFVDGDAFTLTVRQDIPPAERTAYRELQ